MSGLRITGTILLAIAVLCGLAALFMPTAHTIVGAKEEIYSLWDVTVEVGAASTETAWSDNDADGTGGITYLRAAVIPFIFGLILALTGLILTAVPRTSEGRLGGIFAALGFVSLTLGAALHVGGLILHNEQVFGNPGWFEAMSGSYLIAIAGIALLAAALMGMVSTIQSMEDAPRMPAGSGDRSRLRRLRCPKCSNIEAVAPGFLPTCESCGYSA